MIGLTHKGHTPWFSWLAAAITRLDPYAVQSYMGHQHYSTTQRYLHHKPKREDAAALEEAFGKNVSPTVSRTAENRGNSAQLSNTKQARDTAAAK